MAYTLQFGNTWKEAEFRSYIKNTISGTCFEYKQIIGNLSPALSIQADILYPNALASVSSETSTGHNQIAVGCRGNQLDNEFPLESRVQTCLPLIQYPTSTRGSSVEEMDMCAKPVLNWERHIKELKRILRIPLGYTNPSLNSRKDCFKTKTESKEPGDEGVINDEEDVPLNLRILSRTRAKRNTAKSKIGSKKKVTFSDETNASKNKKPESERKSGEHDLNDRDCDEDVSAEESSSEDSESEAEIDIIRRIRPGLDSLSRKIRRKYLGKNRAGPTKRFKTFLFEEQADLEETPAERRKREKQQKKHGKPKINKPKITLRPVKTLARDRLPLYCIRKYKSVPELKIQGTWNHLYGGMSGACSTMESIYDSTCRNVFVGSGTQLRMLYLKPSDRDSMLSYKIDSIWEEEKHKVPTNIRPGLDEPLSDLIYEIVPDQRNGIVAVRRGKSVEFYDVSEVPHLIISSPNICFGRKDYFGWKLRRFIKDPLLISVDINPYCAGEMITMDENLVVNLSSYCDGRALSAFNAPIETINRRQVPFRQYPNFKINETAGGVNFVNATSLLMWADSCIHICDRRLLNKGGHLKSTDRTKVFDLRRSISSFAWSDQMYFQRGGHNKILNEFVSSVKQSENDNYYYVGTTSRLFLMDWRVPDNPVMKMNHGMRSAATYIDTYNDGNYEVVVAGAQRTHETFCLVTDHAHASCTDRPECTARNPIMLSYPRHLSNSRDFHHEVQVQHMINSWPSDLNRTKDHNYAWTTGLSICKSPRGNNAERPPGIAVFTGNHYGDIFYQEWDQAPVESERKTRRGDPKLTNFLRQWRDSMETKPENFDELFVESKNPLTPVDISVFVKAASEAIPNMARVRTKPFDIFTPDSVYHYAMKKKLQSLSAQVGRMKILVKRESDGRRSNRILDVWNEDWQDDDICVELTKAAAPDATNNLTRSDFFGFTTDLPDLPSAMLNATNETPSESLNENQEIAEDNNTWTEDQQKILNTIKKEMEDDVIVEDDGGSDSDVLFCDDDDDEIGINADEVDLADDINNQMAKDNTELDMSQNAQRFSTQDLDEVTFPGLSDFYPVYSDPSHILPGYGQDEFYNQTRTGSSFSQNQYGTIDQDDDDDLPFRSSQAVGYSQELFSQPDTQQFFFQSYGDNSGQDQVQDTKISPFPYNPLDTGPSTSGTSRPSSQPNSQSKSQSRKSGF